jgi:hypothetical protein
VTALSAGHGWIRQRWREEADEQDVGAIVTKSSVLCSAQGTSVQYFASNREMDVPW